MKYEEIINNRFSEPAAILSYKDGALKLLGINDRFIPELWMNVSKDEFAAAFPQKCFDDKNKRIFVEAIKKCISEKKEQLVETWRQVFSNSCGCDRICVKSRLVLIEETEDGAVIYEGIKNISNEKQMQDTLNDIEYRYKHASEQINIYNWEYTIATREMRPCYRCMRDLGLPALVQDYPEPAIEAGIFPPDYAEMYREMMRRVDSGVPELEADIPLTVGRVPFRIKYTTEFDKDGMPVKAFGSATLISETELGHIRLDNQIIASLAETYQCIYLVDFINDTVKIIKQEELLSLKENAGYGDLASMILQKLGDLSASQKAILADAERLRTELFRDNEKREFVYKDGDEDRWIRIDFQVIERGYKGNGIDRLLITASVIDDLRAQKMDADQQIASQKKELEERHDMLLSAIELANKANEAKTEFFSNMSHDIRTPMNAIMGFSKLAVEEIDDREHLQDYLDKIVTASGHLKNLINDILDMSQIESGKMELSPSPVRLKQLLLETADLVRIEMEKRRLRFFVDVDSMGEDLISCDKLRFNQVILNLLSNACKYTPEGGQVFLEGKLLRNSMQSAQIRKSSQDNEDGHINESSSVNESSRIKQNNPINAESHVNQNNPDNLAGRNKLTYEIRVKDTGIGMSEEFREHIWEAYSREKTEYTQETQGTGLGMLIVQKIINLMQGTIELVTELGKGSEFIIRLPVMTAAVDFSGAAKSKDVEDALDKDYSGITVLVVDDTAINLKLAERVLGKFGFTVKKAESGVEAVQLLKDASPGEINLVLMDVKMPVMDGLEATRRIRAFEDRTLSHIPVIAMTANAFESDVKETLDAGMNAHIPKPYTKEELITTINRTLCHST